jgi:hypothetical protein
MHCFGGLSLIKESGCLRDGGWYMFVLVAKLEK